MEFYVLEEGEEKATVFFSCPSSSGNYYWENLPLSEMHLGLVFAASAFFSVTVVWKWVFKQTENSGLQIKALGFEKL